MDRSELVLAIVLEQENTFEKLLKKDVHKLLLTSKVFHENKNIVRHQTKYHTWYLYYALYKSVSALGAFRYEDDESKMALQQKCQDILGQVKASSEEMQVGFYMVLFAEFKEEACFFLQTMLALYDNRKYNTVKAFYELLHKNDEIYNMLCIHTHDESSYLFEDCWNRYRFLDYEDNGVEVVDLWETYCVKKENRPPIAQ